MLQILKKVFQLQFLFIILAIVAGVYYKELLQYLEFALKDPIKDDMPAHFKGEQQAQAGAVFSKPELALFNGEHGTPLYLAILGSVFDVSKGEKHYGIGCSYHYFVGRDASVSFVTGEFENYDENTADDVIAQLKHNDLLSLQNWLQFYHKEYEYKGRLVGRFYDIAGQPTAYQQKYQQLLQTAQELKAAEDNKKLLYPECNIEWSETTGSRVWCTRSSGGKERSWTGYPRKLYEMGSANFRCACIKKEELNTKDVMIKPYENCAEFARECFYKID